MSERRYSPLATLFAATFLFRIGNAVAALALPWFVLSHTKSAAWAGATAASSVIATIIGAWVGGGLVDRFGRAPVALISGVVGGVAMASIPLLDAVGALSNTGLIACVVLGAALPIRKRKVAANSVASGLYRRSLIPLRRAAPSPQRGT
ncbi:hypothetical protein ACSLOQ_28440, partial [Klebsiella pneumoniae]